MYLGIAYSCDLLNGAPLVFYEFMCTPSGGVAYALRPLFTAVLFGYLLSNLV